MTLILILGTKICEQQFVQKEMKTTNQGNYGMFCVKVKFFDKIFAAFILFKKKISRFRESIIYRMDVYVVDAGKSIP